MILAPCEDREFFFLETFGNLSIETYFQRNSLDVHTGQRFFFWRDSLFFTISPSSHGLEIIFFQRFSLFSNSPSSHGLEFFFLERFSLFLGTLHPHTGQRILCSCRCILQTCLSVWLKSLIFFVKNPKPGGGGQGFLKNERFLERFSHFSKLSILTRGRDSVKKETFQNSRSSHGVEIL